MARILQHAEEATEENYNSMGSQYECSRVQRGDTDRTDSTASVHAAYLDGHTVICPLTAAYWGPLARVMLEVPR